MKTQLLNLINSDKSDIKWRISRYPDGQIHLELLDDIDRKNDLRIMCRLRNSDELFLLAQLGNILQQIQVIPEILDIKYLLAARTDRVFELGRQALDLRIVADIVNSLNAGIVRITDVHSSMATKLIKNSISYEYDWWLNSEIGIISDNPVIVFPDEGAYKRSEDRLYRRGDIDNIHRIPDMFYFRLYGEKVRGKDGSVISLKLNKCPGSHDIWYPECSNYNYYIVDDLSDGGGTFIKLADDFRKRNKDHYKSLNLIVTHMIQEDGLKKLSEVYDNVYTTNSYMDRKTGSYKNVTIIDLLL